MKLSGNKILITGGATGIGLGMAERFAHEGNRLILCGRREAVLREAAGRISGAEYYPCDLTRVEERKKLRDWVGKNHPDLTVLVNNAGIQQWMGITDNDFYVRAKEEIAINIEAPVHLCHLFAGMPSLRTVINVTSGLSFVPLTKVPVYSASKAFFHSFTISLRAQLKERNIEVIEVIPPALNTDLGGKGLHDSFPPVDDFVQSMFKQLAEGSTEITFGFSQVMIQAGPDELKKAFERMNG
ncbi:MAG: SDR family NAD(P)-dependent oxidoreductase [Bacteroidetes bacterium]|nr:SDR family NAD(P)-dependent oxidoreductase [Bacteroidota bacterium]MBS1976947.1 SDR family NAD(P)-dependent oxidoreductase [Bacteroidota bacterium]